MKSVWVHMFPMKPLVKTSCVDVLRTLPHNVVERLARSRERNRQQRLMNEIKDVVRRGLFDKNHNADGSLMTREQREHYALLVLG